jgi:hypothetical protein
MILDGAGRGIEPHRSFGPFEQQCERSMEKVQTTNPGAASERRPILFDSLYQG